jgi:predicted ferric reductase
VQQTTRWNRPTATLSTGWNTSSAPVAPTEVFPADPRGAGRTRSNTIGPADRVARSGLGHRRRRRVWLAFWLGVFVCLLPWWLDTPSGAVSGASQGVLEAGRVTGLLGGYVLLLQILVMSRVGWLERRLGAAEIIGWHRDLGGLVLFLVLAHVALITVGYGWSQGYSPVRETFTLLTTYEDMFSAYLATALLVGIGLMAVRAVRRALPYELWYYLHLSAYAALLLGYGHQFATGQELAPGTAGRWIWIGLYVFVLANLAWGRFVVPVALNLTHRLRVADVVPEGPDIFSIYIAGERLDQLHARAGQFFRWRFMARGCWWQAHPFSLSAAPNERWLRLTIKAVGDHTERLRRLRPGVRVFAEGPSGAFTADQRTRPRALLIAAGSGIAPIRALLEDLPRGAVVVYRASTPDELIFKRELDWLARERDADVWYVLGSRHDPAPRRALSPRGLRELVPDVHRRDVYLCGPQGLVATARKSLRRLRVPRRQIHLDPFEF